MCSSRIFSKQIILSSFLSLYLFSLYLVANGFDPNFSKALPNISPKQGETLETLKATGLVTDQNGRVNFYLFNRSGNVLEEQLVLMNTEGTVPKKLWNTGGEIKVLVHGYHIVYTYSGLDSLDDQRIPLIAQEYGASNQSLNIIIVEWSSLSIRLNYAQAAENTRFAGRAVAEFLILLKNNGAFEDWRMVHLIGFSLGSHVSGSAGYQVQKLAQENIGRITGLDPAGPLFDVEGEQIPKNLTGFLDRSDADFVDIIHCNMGGFRHWSSALKNGRLGSFVPAGHADFYPNGGINQMYQCTLDWNRLIGCSHRCCVLFYAISITSPARACPCTSWAEYGIGNCECSEERAEFMGDQCRITISDSSAVNYLAFRARGKYFLQVTWDVSMTDMINSLKDDTGTTDLVEKSKRKIHRRNRKKKLLFHALPNSPSNIPTEKIEHPNTKSQNTLDVSKLPLAA